MKVLEGAITLYKLTYFAHPRCIDNCAKWKEMPEVVVNYFVCYFALEIFLLKLLKGCLILLLKNEYFFVAKFTFWNVCAIIQVLPQMIYLTYLTVTTEVIPYGAQCLCIKIYLHYAFPVIA